MGGAARVTGAAPSRLSRRSGLADREGLRISRPVSRRPGGPGRRLSGPRQGLIVDRRSLNGRRQRLIVDDRRLVIDRQRLIVDRQSLIVDHQRLIIDDQ